MLPGNYNLQVKKTFLSFAQSLFAEHPKYTWDPDVTKTKILIVDKNVHELENIEPKRAIIASRGSLGWQYQSKGQLKKTDLFREQDETYQDILRGSIVFHCVTREGLVSEELANLLFSNLTAMKQQFKKNGIEKIRQVQIGEETILKSNSNVELWNVQVFVQFESIQTIYTGFDVYENFYLTDQEENKHYQGATYRLTSASGLSFFEAPPSGMEFTAHYVNAITLNEEEETLTGAIDGSNTDFVFSYPSYGEFPILSGLHIEATGEAWTN